MADNSFRIKSGSVNLKPQSSAPISPVLGDIYIDASGELKRFDGVSFVTVASGGAANSIISSELDVQNLNLAFAAAAPFLQSTLASLPSDDGSVLGGSVPALGGGGNVLGGSAPALAGTGGVLGGSSPALAGTGGTLAGSAPAAGGTGNILGGSVGFVNFLNSLFFFPVYSFTSPTTSVTATLRSSLGSGPFHNVPINLSTGLTVGLSSPVNEQVFLRVQSQNNSDFKDSPPVAINIATFPTSIKRISNIRNDLSISDGNQLGTSAFVIGTSIYFAANNANAQGKIYKLNTATDSITQISNIRNSQLLSDTSGSIFTTIGAVVGSSLFFTGLNTNGASKVFKINTSTDVITQISNTRNNQTSSDQPLFTSTSYTVVGSSLYFIINNLNGVNKIFKINSITDAITQVSNTRNNQSTTDSPALGTSAAVVGSSIYYPAHNSNGSFKIFKIDTTTDIITQISNTTNNQLTSDTSSFGASANIIGNAIYFSSNNSNGASKIYKLNTTTDTVTQVSNLSNNQATSDSFSIGSNARVVGSSLYFTASNVNGFTKVFKLDSLTDTITQISNTTNSQTLTDNASLSAAQSTLIGTSIYFVANNSNNAAKIYKLNTTTDTVTQISNTRNAQASADSPQLGTSATVVGTSIYFLSNNANGAQKVFKLDTTTDTIISISNTRDSLTAGDNAFLGTNSVVVGSAIYFVANNALNFQKIFKINTSTDMVTQVSNTRNSQLITDGASLSAVFVSGSFIYYAASNFNGVSKIFRLDTTNDSIIQVSNTRENMSQTDNPALNSATVIGSKLYFSSNDSAGAFKIYSITP